MSTVHEGVIVSMALFGADAWGMRSAERRKVSVLQMKFLKNGESVTNG